MKKYWVLPSMALWQPFSSFNCKFGISKCLSMNLYLQTIKVLNGINILVTLLLSTLRDHCYYCIIESSICFCVHMLTWFASLDLGSLKNGIAYWQSLCEKPVFVKIVKIVSFMEILGKVPTIKLEMTWSITVVTAFLELRNRGLGTGRIRRR